MRNMKVGHIGFGGRGIGLLKNTLLIPGMEIAAVCDVYQDRAEKAACWVKLCIVPEDIIMTCGTKLHLDMKTGIIG